MCLTTEAVATPSDYGRKFLPRFALTNYCYYQSSLWLPPLSQLVFQSYSCVLLYAQLPTACSELNRTIKLKEFFCNYRRTETVANGATKKIIWKHSHAHKISDNNMGNMIEYHYE